jgi:hypothetical protein
MTEARTGAAAVQLTDGRILITGGSDSNGIPQATAEVFDPATGAFAAVPDMTVPRASHAAIVLKTGDVLVTGGLTTGGAYSDSAEIYSVSSQQWTLVPSSIGTGLAGHAMALLSDGNVLIAGGTSTTKVVSSIVLFNVTTETFAPIGTLLTPRTGAAAAATPDGRVLIVGGIDINGAVLASTEIFTYSPSTMTGTETAGPTMTAARVGATATSTYDGVAVIGGNNGQNDLGTAEIFSQWTNTFTVVSGGTPRSYHFAMMLPENGSILAMGGTGGTKVDLLEPWANNKTGSFVSATDSLFNQDGGFASPLVLGSVLAGGGMGSLANSAELYWFPTISTDKPDYAPGTPVQMSGTGFQPSEMVDLHLHLWVDQSTEDAPDATVDADALGNLSYSGYAPNTTDIGARYHLTAVGRSSGYQAQTIFTDGLTYIDFSNVPLDQPAAPASGTATAAECGELIFTVGGSAPYGTIDLTDSTTTGSFYTSLSSCESGANAITSFTPQGPTTDLYYRNSATGTPQLTACSGADFFGFCFGGDTASQYESIYGTATQITFQQQPGGGAPIAVWLQQPIVAVQDASYNTVPTNSDPIELTISTNPGNGTLTCAHNPLNASSGVATFSGCSINPSTSSSSCYYLQAKDQTLGFVVTSSCFYIGNSASAGNSTVVANPTTVLDNGTATSTITVTLKDANGNLLANKTVTLSAGGGSSQICQGGTCPAYSGTTNASGVVTFTVSDAVAQSVTYTATDTTDGVTITQTATVTFAPGQISASSSTISASPTTVSANGTLYSTITVTLQDSGGDAVSGATVTLSQGSGHSTITTVTGVTNSNGQAQFTVTDTTVESVTYTASYSSTSNGSGTLTHTVTVTFTAIATTLNLTVSPNSIPAGSSVELIVGLSVTSGGAAVGPGATVNFYEATGTCSASSTLIATETTDSTGTATDPSYGSALAAGTYHICAYFTAATINNVSYSGASSGSQTLTVTNSTPTLSWKTAPPPSEVYNGTFTPVAATPASGNPGYSPCTISYGVTGGCSIGRNNLVTMTSGTTSCVVTASVAACTSGGITYGSATLTATVTATLATQATLVLHGVPTGAVGDGATFTVSTTGGSGTGTVTYSVTGACTVSGTTVTMDATGSGQTCTVTATKASDGDYASATSAPATTGQSNGTAVVTISNTSQTYTGNPLPVTVTTAPPGLTLNVTYTGINGTVYAQSTTAPTAVGTYSVSATVTTPGVTGSATATETISQAAAGLTLALQSGTSSPAPYGTTDYFVLTLPSCTAPNGPMGTVTLIVDGNPVAGAGGTGTLDGSCTAVVFSTATIEASSTPHDVYVQFASTNSNYPSGVSNTLYFTVSADTTQVTLAYTGSPMVGQSLTFTATITPGALSSGTNGPQGTVEFFDGTTELDVAPGETLINNSGTYTATFTTSALAEGSHQITATYVPAPGDPEFAGSSSSVTIQVNYVAPQINWTAPQPIVYGTPLDQTELNATAIDTINGNVTVPGTFTYTPAAGYVLGAGTTNLMVSFVPTDTSTYGAGPYTATVSITVTPVGLTVTADNQTMVYGAAVPTLTATITGFVNGDVPSQVTGEAACTTTATSTSTVAGSPYPITCMQGSLAEPNYTFTTFVPGQLTVTTATPTLSLVCPAATYDGTAHSCAGVALGTDGSTPVTGNWTYSPGSETNVGSYPETGTFTSTDPDYVISAPNNTATATLVIDQATSSVTLTCPPSVAYNGAAQTPCTATYSGAGGLSGAPTITYSNNTNAGTATATASFSGDSNHTASSNTVTFAISPVAVTASAGSGTWVYNGNQDTIPACTLVGSFTTNLSCSETPTMVGAPAGTGTVTPSVSVINGDVAGNYTITLLPGTWTISQAPSTVSITCPSSVVYNGTAQTPCMATLTGVGLTTQSLPITYTANTGVGTANASASYAGDTNHSPSSYSVNFAITPAPVTATAGGGTWVYNGSAESPAACVVSGAYTGTLTCTNNPTTVGPAVGSGSGSVTGITPVVSGDTLSNYQITYVYGSWSITQATSTVSVSCPPSVVYNGQPQSPCSATVSGPGLSTTSLTVNYTSNTNVGTVTASASYPGGTNNSASDGSATFTITPAAITVTAGSGSWVYNASTETLPACTVTGVAFASGVTCTNNPTSVGPAVGSGAVTLLPLGGDTGNFTITQVNGTWSITAEPAMVTLSNLAQFYTGSPLPVTVTTSPSGLAVTVLYGTTGDPTDPTSTTPPTAVGNYAVLATIANPDYVGSATGTLAISTGSVNLSTALALHSGTAEPSLYGQNVEFDLTLSGSPCPSGTVTWTLDGVAQTPMVTLPDTCSAPVTYQTDTLSVGSHTLFATYSGDGNYGGGQTNTVTHGIAADTTTVTLGISGSPINVDQAETFTAVVQPEAIPGSGALVPTGTVNFFNGTTQIGTGTLEAFGSSYLATFTTTALPVGTNSISATYVSTDGTEYDGSSSTVDVTVMVDQIAPKINWNPPANIVYGTALSATQLNATATDPTTGDPVPPSPGGGFVYNPAAGTVLNAGSTTLGVTFTPTNTTVYSTATASVPITVTPATPTLSLTCTAVTYNGNPQQTCVGSETGVTGGATPTGTWSYSPATETNAGTYTITGTFTSSSGNYQSGGTATGTLTINPAQVTATAGSDTWVYNGSTETVPACTLTGSYTAGLSCADSPATVGPGATTSPQTVTPNVTAIGGDSLSNYSITKVNGSYSITLATSTVTVTCNPTSVVYNGTAQTPCTASVTGAGGLTGSPTVTYTNNINAGTATASATYAGDANHSASSGSTTFTITVAPVTATAGSYNAVYDGATHATSPACLVTGTYIGNLTCTNNPATVGPGIGSGTVTPTISGTGQSNFAITDSDGTWSIALATPTLSLTCTTATYNGAAHSCVGTATGVGGATVAGTWVYSPASETNAGTYPVTGTFTSTNNDYVSGGTATGTLTINPAAVTATAGSYSGVYNGATATPSACAVTGAYTTGVTCADNPATVGPGVGTGTVTPTVSGATANFTVTSVNGAWSITDATSTVTVTCPASVTYNGAAQTPCTAKVTGAGGLSQALTPTYTSNTNVGAVTVSASYAGDANHSASSGSVTFAINPAPVTATAGSYSGVYNGATATPSACAVTGAYTTGVTCADNPATVGPGVGTGTVTPTVSGATTNFTVTSVNGAWSITGAAPTLSLTCTTATYNGAAHSCVGTATGIGGVTVAGTWVYSPASETNAGTYPVTGTFTSTNSDYQGGTATGTLTINPAAVTATAGSYSGVYTGATATPSACAVTGAYTTGVTCADNPASVGPAVGTGTVTPTVSGGTANFTVTSVNGAWSITGAAPTLSLTCTTVTYNGAAHSCVGTATGIGGATVAGTWVYSPASETNAGTYPVTGTFTSTDSDYLSGGTATGTLTINPAAVTATAGSYNGVYNGATATPSACAVTGAYTTGVTCADNPATVGPGIGTGTVTPTVSGATANFTVTSVNGAWSITAATPTLSLTCTTVTYDGAAHSCVGTATGVGGATVAGTWVYSPASETNAGTYPVTGTFTSTNSDYQGGIATGTLTINPAAVTATAGSYSGVYTGATATPSACAVTGAYTTGVTCADNPASVGPAVGTGTVTPTVSGGTANFTVTSVNGAWSITGAAPTLSLTCTTVTYNGAAHSCVGTATGIGGATVAGTWVYSPASETNAGTYPVTGTFTSTDSDYLSGGTATGTLTINPAAVTATAGSYNGVYNGATATPSACAVTGAYTTGVTCADNPASVGPAVGTGTVTPTVSGAGTNFTVTSVNGAWTISDATSTVTMSCPASVVYNGAAQTPCTATATGAGGLSQSLTVTYTNNTNPGTATASASFAGDANHTASSNSATFTITQEPATVTLSNLAQFFTGSPATPVTVTTMPPGLAVSVLYSSASYPSSATPPTAVGSYTVTATVTNPDYVGSATGTLVISTASSGLTLVLRSGTSNPSPYGTMVYFDLGLGGTPCPTGTVQFYVDGSASGSPVTLNGSSCSSPITFQTATLVPGTHSVYATYSGDANYAAGTSNTVQLTVSADTTSVTLAASAMTVNVGQQVTFTATVNPTSLNPSANGPAGTVEFFDGTTQIGTITLSSTSPYTAAFSTSTLAAGSHSISATYLPGSDDEFTGSSSAVAVTVSVDKIAPTITWAAPANIVYGTALSGTQLNATATDPTTNNMVPGTFTYTPPAGTVLAVGTVNLQVLFTPADPTTYSTQTATVTLTVTPAPLTVTANNLSLTAGSTIPTLTATITGFVNGDTSAVVSGAASCTTTATSASPAGTYPITCTVGTLAAANYTFTFVSGTLTLNSKTTPTVTTLPTASAITYGQTLASSTLSGGVASVGGSFAWTTSTTTPGAGTPSESVTFTPTDTTDYNTVTVTITVTVNKATLTVTANNLSLTAGSTIPTLTATITGFVNGDTSAVVSGAASCTTTATSASPAGTYPITCTVGTLAAANYTFTFVSGTLTLNSKTTPTVTTLPTASAITYGQTLASSTLSGGVASVGGSFAWTTSTTTPGAGTPSESVTFTPTDTTDYNTVTVTITVTVNQAPATVTLGNLAQFFTGSPATPVAVTTVPPGLAVSVLYSNASYPSSATPPTAVGSYTVTATVTDPNYVGSASGTLVISTASTSVSLALRSGTSNPSPYGTMVYFDLSLPGLGSSLCPTGTVQFYVDGSASGSPVTLNGSSCSSPITFQTATLVPATHSVYATYSGDANYAAGTSNTVQLTVSADTTSVTLAASAMTVNVGQQVTFTATVNPTALNPSASGPAGTVEFFDGTTQIGTITLSSTSPYTAVFSTSTLAAGSHSISATYLPGSDDEFTGGSSSAVMVTVSGSLIAPTITWAAPANIVYGTALSETQLNATATDPTTTNMVPGAFAYTPPAGTVLAVGTVNLQVLFTPADPTTYSTQTATVTLTVTPAPLTVTANNQNMVLGGTVPTLTYTITGFVNGDTSAVVSGAASCTTTATATSPAGNYPITCTLGTLSAANYTFTFVGGTLTVTSGTAIAPTLSLTCATATYNGSTHACAGTATGTGGAAVAGTWSYNPPSETAAGSYPVTGTFTSTDPGYQSGTATGTLTINPAAVTATAGGYSGVYDGSTHATAPACAVTGAYTGSLNCTNTPTTVGAGAGTGTVTPTVGGDTLSNYAINAVNGAWSITQAPSTVAVSCPASVVYGGAAQAPCTATVTGAGGLSQSLTVTYTNNTNVGTATASANFAGDANHTASSSSASFTITQASQAIAFTQPASPVTYGVPPITLSATGGASGKPVVFSIDASSSGSGTISGSTLTITGVGNLIIDANQAGDSDYLAATQVSRTIVVGQETLTVAANNASRVYGANNPAFGGSVTGTVNGDVFTESFSTVATVSSNVGTYPIIPSVAGTDLADYSVTVQDGTLTITQAGTTTSVTTSSSSVTPGQSVTLTAMVVSATTGTPTGSVAFYDGTALLGTAPLTAGAAAMSTTSLTAGSSNAINAVYSGDNNFTTSTGSTSIGVAALDFALAVTGADSATVNPGSAATYQVAVTPLYGTYPGPVSFTASGLPTGASITFSPSTIAADGGNQTVTLTIQTAAMAMQVSPSTARRLAPLTLAFLLIPLLGVRRMRRQGRRLSRLATLLLLLCCTLAGVMMTGCGGVFTQTERDYTIVVTATSGNTQHTAPVTLKVE